MRILFESVNLLETINLILLFPLYFLLLRLSQVHPAEYTHLKRALSWIIFLQTLLAQMHEAVLE